MRAKREQCVWRVWHRSIPRQVCEKFSPELHPTWGGKGRSAGVQCGVHVRCVGDVKCLKRKEEEVEGRVGVAGRQAVGVGVGRNWFQNRPKWEASQLPSHVTNNMQNNRWQWEQSRHHLITQKLRMEKERRKRYIGIRGAERQRDREKVNTNKVAAL